MVQAMDHKAVEGDLNQEAVEGAVDGASDGRNVRIHSIGVFERSVNTFETVVFVKFADVELITSGLLHTYFRVKIQIVCNSLGENTNCVQYF